MPTVIKHNSRTGPATLQYAANAGMYKTAELEEDDYWKWKDRQRQRQLDADARKQQSFENALTQDKFSYEQEKAVADFQQQERRDESLDDWRDNQYDRSIYSTDSQNMRKAADLDFRGWQTEYKESEAWRRKKAELLNRGDIERAKLAANKEKEALEREADVELEKLRSQNRMNLEQFRQQSLDKRHSESQTTRKLQAELSAKGRLDEQSFTSAQSMYRAEMNTVSRALTDARAARRAAIASGADAATWNQRIEQLERTQQNISEDMRDLYAMAYPQAHDLAPNRMTTPRAPMAAAPGMTPQTQPATQPAGYFPNNQPTTNPNALAYQAGAQQPTPYSAPPFIDPSGGHWNPHRTFTAPSGRQYTLAQVMETAQRHGKHPQQVISELGLR